MKHVIIRCEDRVRLGQPVAALLEGAKTMHLQHLAHAGAAGLIRRAGPGRNAPATGQFQFHVALCGIEMGDAAVTPGRCAAAGAQASLGPGEQAWCCDLLTQHDGIVMDDTAGGITTRESTLLIQALEEQLGTEGRRWEVGSHARHVVILEEPTLPIDEHTTLRAPELLLGHAWQQALPKGPVGEQLAALIQSALPILERHPINRVRIDLGENPANVLWLWGPGGCPASTRTWSERTGLSGAMLSDDFLMHGAATVLGLDWHAGPGGWDDASLQQTLHDVERLLQRQDLVDVHVRLDTPDPVERLCAMERMDQLLLKPLTERLPPHGAWRLAVVVDDTRLTTSTPFIAIGTGLPQQPVSSLSVERLTESPLALADGNAFFSWFVQQQQATRNKRQGNASIVASTT